MTTILFDFPDGRSVEVSPETVTELLELRDALRGLLERVRIENLELADQLQAATLAIETSRTEAERLRDQLARLALFLTLRRAES